MLNPRDARGLVIVGEGKSSLNALCTFDCIKSALSLAHTSLREWHLLEKNIRAVARGIARSVPIEFRLLNKTVLFKLFTLNAHAGRLSNN